ncbi:hypothetical protein C9975_10335, partial [Thalassospira xiamenensis]
REKCIAVCLGVGQAESLALDKVVDKQRRTYNDNVCETSSVNSKVKASDVLLKAGAAGKILSIATSADCMRRCF